VHTLDAIANHYQDEKMTELNENEETLTNFITNNPELDQLEVLVAEFNPFSVLDIVHHEIRHSNVLAWLLDPNENHGLGDAVLRRIIIEVLKQGTTSFPLSVAEIIRCQFNGVAIHREYKAKTRRIDILLECAQPRFVMIVENKLRAGESKNQLRDYLDYVTNKFHTTPVLPIYLTISGDDPSDTNYATLSHCSIHSILKNILNLHRDNLNPKKYEFIEYYLKSLEEEVMENPKIREYARAIYAKHKKAIELILKYGISNLFEEAAKKFLAKHNNLEHIDTRSYWAWFVPKDLKPSHAIEMEQWISPYPVACWFIKRQDDKLGIVVEVGPIRDKQKRVQLMEAMKRHNELRVPKNSTSLDARYTRVFSKYIEFEDWDNEELILEKMDVLYNKEAKYALQVLGQVVPNFDWSK
jgi:hypothetical protein